MGCSPFTVTVKDIPKALKTAQSAIKGEGGSFSGNAKKGSYSVTITKTVFGIKTNVGTLEGTYAVSGNDITLKNTTTGAVTCKAVEKFMQKHLK